MFLISSWKFCLIKLMVFFPILAFGQNYKFEGVHFLASYLDCDQETLTNIPELGEAVKKATILSGAKILNTLEHVFFPSGFSMVILLSESHVSIHTYPEHKACFIDLFTCGNSCSSQDFDRYLRSYLKPARVETRSFLRGERILEKVMTTQ